VKDIGSGIKVASVRDPFGNSFSIIANPHFKRDDKWPEWIPVKK
jgi:hypothetical protein